MRSLISLYILFFQNYVLLLYTFIFIKKHHLPYRKERYINALGVMHNAVILPQRATRCRYWPRAWVLVRLAWPGSAAQGKPRRRQARQAVALRRLGKTRKVSPGFEKYCTFTLCIAPTECTEWYVCTHLATPPEKRCRNYVWRIRRPIRCVLSAHQILNSST